MPHTADWEQLVLLRRIGAGRKHIDLHRQTIHTIFKKSKERYVLARCPTGYSEKV